MVLSEFVEGVLNRFDKGEAACAVLLDLSKSFDSVDRKDFAKTTRMLWCKRENAIFN